MIKNKKSNNQIDCCFFSCPEQGHDLFSSTLIISDFVCFLFQWSLLGNSIITCCLIIQISFKYTKFYGDTEIR